MRRYPGVYHRVRVRGRRKAEGFRASHVYPRLMRDLLADVATFGTERRRLQRLGDPRCRPAEAQIPDDDDQPRRSRAGSAAAIGSPIASAADGWLGAITAWRACCRITANGLHMITVASV